MDQLPEHVVGGLLRLLDDRRIVAGHGEGVLGDVQRRPAPVIATVSIPSRLASARNALIASSGRRGRSRARCRRAGRAGRGSVAPAVSLLGRDRRQGALADDHRVHELDGGVSCVGRRRAGPERDQRAAAREVARHRMTGAGQALGLALEEAADDPLPLGDRSSSEAVRSEVVTRVGHRLTRCRLSSAPRAPARRARRAPPGTLASGRASSSSIFDIAKPTWIRTQSPMPTASGPSASRPTLTLRRTPETSALAMRLLARRRSRRSDRECQDTCYPPPGRDRGLSVADPAVVRWHEAVGQHPETQVSESGAGAFEQPKVLEAAAGEHDGARLRACAQAEPPPQRRPREKRPRSRRRGRPLEGRRGRRRPGPGR